VRPRPTAIGVLALGLTSCDVVPPIPQTAVIAALGIIDGTLLGGLLGSLGLITGGLLGYGLMFTAARRFARRVAGLAGMPMREFIAALIVGSVPTASTFAASATPSYHDVPAVPCSVRQAPSAYTRSLLSPVLR
jgi:uncharacterized membrane protein YdjX (TVP38/TMEM64 family)